MARLGLDRKTVLLLFLFLALISLPYIFAALSAGPDQAFGGFLINYQDGYSYLGKMRQGFDGHWLFRPDYTVRQSAGALINLPYVLIGQLARLGGPLIVWLHSFRILHAMLLFFSLKRFINVLIQDDATRWRALSLALFGSGMGWLLLGRAELPPDFWVAEAYPFLSSYTNVHFPLGLALQLWLLTPNEDQPNWREALSLALGAATLGLVSAFSVPVVLAVWGGIFMLKLLARDDVWSVVRRGAAITLGGGLVIAYDYWVILRDPVLADWNGQNLTPSPPIWELLLAFAPALLAAAYGLLRSKQRHSPEMRLLTAWAVMIPILVYLPFPLQRRFLVGYSIPVAILAVMVVHEWVKPERQRMVWRVVFGLALPTNILILLSGMAAAFNHPPEAYLATYEVDAFRWMEQHLMELSAQPAVLAAPETGLLLPAYTGATVLYGHPFESYQGASMKPLVEAAYAESDISLLEDFPEIDFVYVGPREDALCGEGGCDFSAFDNLTLVYKNGFVTLYHVADE
jgi:hypothetical protein